MSSPYHCLKIESNFIYQTAFAMLVSTMVYGIHVQMLDWQPHITLDPPFSLWSQSTPLAKFHWLSKTRCPSLLALPGLQSGFNDQHSAAGLYLLGFCLSTPDSEVSYQQKASGLFRCWQSQVSVCLNPSTVPCFFQDKNQSLHSLQGIRLIPLWLHFPLGSLFSLPSVMKDWTTGSNPSPQGLGIG